PHLPEARTPWATPLTGRPPPPSPRAPARTTPPQTSPSPRPAGTPVGILLTGWCADSRSNTVELRVPCFPPRFGDREKATGCIRWPPPCQGASAVTPPKPVLLRRNRGAAATVPHP